MLNLDANISSLKGVGDKKRKCYEKLGVKTAGDLLCLYPRNYLDFTDTTAIKDAEIGEVNVIKAKVFKKQPEQRIRKGMTIYKLFVTDDETDMQITIFNNKYLFDSLYLDREYYFYGKTTGNMLKVEMTAPIVVNINEKDLIRPIYPQTEGLNSRAITQNVKDVLRSCGDNVIDPIPAEIVEECNLCHSRFAIQNIHFPTDQNALAVARDRLITEELLILQLGLLRLKSRNREQTSVVMESEKIDDFLEEFYQKLPFELTNAQKKAIIDAAGDICKDEPMNRLVQGDVGSGKTMVAAAISYIAAKNGYQTALMVPTEILAGQHFATFAKMFEDMDVKVCLLTASLPAKAKREMKEGIANGEFDIIIGTHALISQDTAFQNLGLVITDEQHRFGVAQRSTLAKKGENPHVLVMSATPIPRTLALIIYGDLDVSVIDEMPKGRKSIETYMIDTSKRMRALNFVKKHLNEKAQAYIVCPLIDDSDSELIAVTTYAEQLSKGAFSEYNVGLLHGKLAVKQKDEIMAKFLAGEIDLLISTTVIEVGVDVPNAVIMMIENAERFGLSQLHQLRGRVGRGDRQSYCILLSDNEGDKTKQRLKVMCDSSDGFKIAEQDLKLRGPGDFFGDRQHGLPKLKIADMVNDMETLKKTQSLAKRILKQDPELSSVEHKGLNRLLERLFEQAP